MCDYHKWEFSKVLPQVRGTSRSLPYYVGGPASPLRRQQLRENEVVGGRRWRSVTGTLDYHPRGDTLSGKLATGPVDKERRARLPPNAKHCAPSEIAAKHMAKTRKPLPTRKAQMSNRSTSGAAEWVGCDHGKPGKPLTPSQSPTRG